MNSRTASHYRLWLTAERQASRAERNLLCQMQGNELPDSASVQQVQSLRAAASELLKAYLAASLAASRACER